MKTIAIVLGDNDFGNTFVPLLNSINKAIQYSNLPQESVEKCIRAGIEYHYMAFQLGGKSNDRIPQTIQYLSKIRILFDKDAEKDIENEDHDSGAWYLEVMTGEVFPY